MPGAGLPCRLDFGAFAREVWEELVGALTRYCWDGLDPCDVAQEALAVAYAKYVSGADEFPVENPLPYVIGIGRNVARNQGGARQRAATADREAAHAAAVTGRRDLSEIAVENADLARAFASLSPKRRKALLLSSDGYDDETIATLLGLRSAEAAKQTVYRARNQIRKALAVAPCAAVPWWSWRRLGAGRAADSAASVADHAAPAAGPLGQAVSVSVSLSAAVALTLVASLVPKPWDDVVPPTVPAAQAPVPHPSLALRDDGRAAGTLLGPAPADRPRAQVGQPVAARVPSPGPGLPVVARVPVPRPTLPGACAPRPTRRECVDQPGDTVWVGEAGVTQAVVPVCHHVPGSPAVGCTRQEPDEWTVKDVPPVPTGGGTP